MNFIIISKNFNYLNRLMHNSFIPSLCKLGKNNVIAYGGIGVVIHSNAIGQGITIGGRNGKMEILIFQDNVYLEARCRIIGT